MINEDGEIFVTSGVGRASIANKRVLQGSTLQKHIDLYFPQGDGYRRNKNKTNTNVGSSGTDR